LAASFCAAFFVAALTMIGAIARTPTMMAGMN